MPYLALQLLAQLGSQNDLYYRPSPTIMAVSTKLTDVLDDNEVKTELATVTALSLPNPVSVPMLITIRNETQFPLTVSNIWKQYGDWVGGGSPRGISAWSQGCIYVSDSTQVAGGVAYALNIDSAATSAPAFNVVLGWYSDGAAACGAQEGTDQTHGPTIAKAGTANGTTPSVKSVNSWTGTNAGTKATETFFFSIGVDVSLVGKPASPVFTIAQTSSP